MHIYGRLLIIVLPLLIGGAALAQESKGWFGADVLDVTKAEADKLGWDAPHGAKLGVVSSGSPSEKAGLKSGDIILSIDGVEVETGSEVEVAINAKQTGTELRLHVLSSGKERRLTMTLAERPISQAAVPQLMLDTGGHMGAIYSLLWSRDGRNVISGGDDKVIRIWDLLSGKTVRAIRGATGAGNEGKIAAMALSQDERWLAVGGDISGGVIRLHDFKSGTIRRLLTGHEHSVRGLAFSHDGRLLLSGGADNIAMLWEVESGRLLHRLIGHDNDDGGRNAIEAVSFSLDDQLAVTGSFDKTVKLWRVGDGGLVTTLSGHADRVRSLAVSPKDGSIASGDASGEIRIWDSGSGWLLRSFQNRSNSDDRSGSVRGLSFSPDGRHLLAGNGGRGSNYHVRVWQPENGRLLVEYKQHDNGVYAVAISPDGRRAATAGGDNKEIHVWDLSSGEPARTTFGQPQILVGTGRPVFAVAVSSDGQRIAWGNSRKFTSIVNRGPLLSQLIIPTRGHAGLGRPEPIAEAAPFLRARGRHGDAKIGRKAGGPFAREDEVLVLTANGAPPVEIVADENAGGRHVSSTFTFDGAAILSGGGTGSFSKYARDGSVIGKNFVGHEDIVWSLAPFADGSLLVSGSGDQTVRVWNLKTCELIVTLFNGTDGEWVLWTPQGYYTGSPGADKIVGWQIKGPEQAADFVGAEQLRQHLNRPDIVERALILASAEQAVREAPGTTFQLADLLSRPVPRFKIAAPVFDPTAGGGRTTLKITIEATPDPIKAIRVQVNGSQIKELTPDIGSGGFPPGEQLLDVPLAKGRNEVRVTLTNAIGEKAETVTIALDSEGDLDKRGTLYIVAIGVDKYPGLGNSCGASGHESCNLNFAGADVRALVVAAEKRLAPSHTFVVKRVLVNGAGASDSPTATNILDAIDLLKRAKETDTVLLFISGHGFNDGANYRFLPTNAEWASGALRKPRSAGRGFSPTSSDWAGGNLRGATVVPWQVLQEAVETAKGRRILLIDTCHAGNAYNQRLGNAAYHANIIAYTAARFDQTALESPKLGHGLFTYAVVEGLNGKGDLGTKRQISTKELADFVVKRVDQLAKTLNGQQEPQYFKGRDAEDYILARW
jgi:WD40 repeat protein